MANAILTKTSTVNALTISLGTLTAGSGRQSTLVSNTSTHYGAAIIYCAIKTGTAPTAGLVYNVYLLRGDDPSSSTFRTDGAGASDAAITINNAKHLGAVRCTNSTNTVMYAEFDTSPLGPLGKEWGIAVVNDTNQSSNATGGDHFIKWVGYYPEAQ